MKGTTRKRLLFGGLIVAGVAAPWVMTVIVTQLAFLWLMVVFALTWDIMGGQMGYNSFGNIVFFGIGAYVCAVIQRDSGLDYASALAVGVAAGTVAGTIAAALLGAGMLGLRGHYFAIGTLGLSVAAADIAAGWEYIGAGSGIVPPQFPGAIGSRELFFYYLLFVLAMLTFATLAWLYSSRFGITLNAIRDDEGKAEAMGIHTTRYKAIAWCISAFFLAAAGGIAGNLVGFIDPREFAFAGATYGVWMVLMALLGGKGTLWGPVIGAAIFHVTQELFWTYLLGWQRVALGLLIVVIVIFFPIGILGWLRQTWPRRFGRDPDRPIATPSIGNGARQ
jgi:branched-chain amino acid transport system permease protein